MGVFIMKLIKFVARHWIIFIIVVTVIFAVVLPNLADLLQSGVATWIQEVLR